MRDDGKSFVKGQAYSCWTDRLHELSVDGNVPPDVAVVVDSLTIAELIDALHKEIANLKTRITELLCVPSIAASKAVAFPEPENSPPQQRLEVKAPT